MAMLNQGVLDPCCISCKSVEMLHMLIVKLSKAATCDAYAHRQKPYTSSNNMRWTNDLCVKPGLHMAVRVWEAFHAQQVYGTTSRED